MDDQNSPGNSGPGFHANSCLMTENGSISGLESSGSSFVNHNHQVLGQNSSTTSTRTDHSNQAMAFMESFSSHFQTEVAPQSLLRSQSSELSQASHQALVDKMFHEMLAANRGKSAQHNFKRPNNEAAQQSNQTCATSMELRYSESSTAQFLTDTFSMAASHCSKKPSVKPEPCSPDLLPVFSKLEGFGW